MKNHMKRRSRIATPPQAFFGNVDQGFSNDGFSDAGADGTIVLFLKKILKLAIESDEGSQVEVTK
jgi:hypothetical protein